MFIRCGANMVIAHNTVTDLDQFGYRLSATTPVDSVPRSAVSRS